MSSWPLVSSKWEIMVLPGIYPTIWPISASAPRSIYILWLLCFPFFSFCLAEISCSTIKAEIKLVSLMFDNSHEYWGSPSCLFFMSDAIIGHRLLYLLLFCFCPVLMRRFDAFVFGSNPLWSSNIIFVFYISLIIALLLPLSLCFSSSLSRLWRHL